ncbi:Rmf/CrpP family protein [Azospirillum canadense]|uniref:Rmf/CrpP family protein n=1 Tax=Azospirillum canadense TaxID=403962 RepID=UPI0038735680|nr:hypothetical protein [Azospirillum canadense]
MSAHDNTGFWEREGADAAHAGTPRSACPYRPGTVGAVYWCRGYDAEVRASTDPTAAIASSVLA